MCCTLEANYEERSSKRLKLWTKIVILLNSGESIIANTLNISQNGVAMISNLDIPVGTKILAHIYFDTELCEVEGNIIWSSKNPRDDSFKYGIKLLELPIEINKYIKE